MLSEKLPAIPPVEGVGDHEARVRKRRLNDINRGKYYFQRLDKLADNYWSSNEPTIKPHTRTQLRPITDTFYSKQYEKRRMYQMHQQKQHEEKLDDVCKKRVQSDTFILSKEYRDKKRASKPGEHLYNYNKWGSSCDPLDEKLTLKKEDLESRYEPFRFRDNIKHVLKPIPKKSVVMSRVGKQSPDRLLKKQRHFSSDSGMVDVIRPVDTWPDPEENMISYFNPEEIEKESTFVILDRIDKILHPVRHNLLKERGSSEENEPPSQTDNMSDISEPLYPEPVTPDHSKPVSRKHMTVDPAWKRYNHKPVVYLKRTNQKSLTTIVEKLELNKLDAFKKCQLWVVKCKAANWYFDK